jgi:hypothetical protein
MDEASKTRLLNLTTDCSMEKVWSALSRAAPDDGAMVEFLDRARLHSSVRGHGPVRLALTPAQRRRSFGAIAKHAESLLQALQVLAGPAGSADAGLAELEATLRRASKAAAGEGRNTVQVRAESLRMMLEQRQDCSLPEQLRTLWSSPQP